MSNEGYIVVFQGFGHPKGKIAGLRTWCSYPSKAAFEADKPFYDMVVAEGISSQEAVDLVQEVPFLIRLQAMIRSAHGDPLQLKVMSDSMCRRAGEVGQGIQFALSYERLMIAKLIQGWTDGTIPWLED